MALKEGAAGKDAICGGGGGIKEQRMQSRILGKQVVRDEGWGVKEEKQAVVRTEAISTVKTEQSTEQQGRKA